MSAALRSESSHGRRHLARRVPAENVTRQRVEDTIERLIAMLDDLDGDTDREPSLAGARDDREEDAGDEPEYDLDLDESDGGMGMTADNEPTLGFLNDASGFDPEREPSVHIACWDSESEDGHDAEPDDEDVWETPETAGVGWLDLPYSPEAPSTAECRDGRLVGA